MKSKLLLISPVVYPCGSSRYSGIERLVGHWAEGLVRNGYSISVVCADGSTFIDTRIQPIITPRGDFTTGELISYGIYKSELGKFDAIVDFSHSHYAMRENKSLKAFCFTWHDPVIMQPPLPTYNICSLSHWQSLRLYSHQNSNSLIFDPHCGYPVKIGKNHHSIFIGKAHPSKGLHLAVQLCADKLVVIGGLGIGDDEKYLTDAKELAKTLNHDVEFYGEVDDNAKDYLLSNSYSLVFPVNYPPSMGEAHSHKSVDALLAGVPVIAYRQGALEEFITDGFNGYLIDHGDEDKFRVGIQLAKSLNRHEIQQDAISHWGIDDVMKRAISLIERVKDGVRW